MKTQKLENFFNQDHYFNTHDEFFSELDYVAEDFFQSLVGRMSNLVTELASELWYWGRQR